MTAPLFSVLCATHNQAPYLSAMLGSVLAQTRADWELVVVDDGSTDGTADLLQSWRAGLPSETADRVQVLHTTNRGQSAAYEAGFHRTTGEWICLLDSDDTFLPHKLETLARTVRDHPDVGMVQHPLEVMDAGGTTTGDLRPQAATLSSGDLREQMRVDARHVAPGASGLVIRRSTFLQLMPFPTKEFRFAADAYLSFGATATAPVLSLSTALARYRMQPGGQYLLRMLSAEGLRRQVRFQATIAEALGLEAAARRNSFFCRNVYACHRFNGSGVTSWRGTAQALGLLLRATAQDRHFTPQRKTLLLAAWTVSALMPRPAFERFWRAFQMKQTGWRRIVGHKDVRR